MATPIIAICGQCNRQLLHCACVRAVSRHRRLTDDDADDLYSDAWEALRFQRPPVEAHGTPTYTRYVLEIDARFRSAVQAAQSERALGCNDVIESPWTARKREGK